MRKKKKQIEILFRLSNIRFSSEVFSSECVTEFAVLTSEYSNYRKERIMDAHELATVCTPVRCSLSSQKSKLYSQC